MPDNELVLVVERKVFDAVKSFQGISLDVDPYLDAFFTPDTLRFIPRGQAENDPTFKQIIPYVIMAYDDTYFTYVRGKRATEKRLVGHRSIGVGGHINPIDDMPLFSADRRDAYYSAMQREVAEEVQLDAAYTDNVVAILNDDSTEVGRVHLGIVHLWQLDRPAVQKREQMITQFGFFSPSELQSTRDSLESWSQLCLDNLDRLLAVCNS